jgi:EmrB/QacA subfamily drug resistance transporter
METTAKPIGLRSLPRRQIVITFVGVLLTMFLGSLDRTVVGTAMPRIISDLGGFSQYTWVTYVYMITSAVVMPIVGKLTDMYGRKYFYVAGLTVFTASSLMCGLSNSIMQIILWRGIQGIGAGIMMTNSMTVTGDLFPPAERGKYQGLMSGVFGLSSVIGPTLGGFLTDTLSWHWVFFINIPLGIAITLLFIFYFPNFVPDKLKHKIDYWGVTSLILVVVPLMLALSLGGVEYPWSSPIIVAMFVFAVLMVIVFVFLEKRSQEPIIPLGLFKNQIVTLCLVATFLTSFGALGPPTFIPLFFQGVMGSSAITSGNMLIPMMLGTVAGSLLSGQMLSRAGGHYRLLGAVGITIAASGMFLLSRMNIATTNTSAIMILILTGIGQGVIMPIYTIAVQNAVPYNYLGAATSLNPFFFSIGGSASLAVCGSVMNTRFITDFNRGLPQTIKTIVPPDQLTALAHNLQALVSPAAQANLQNILAQLGNQSSPLFTQLLQVLRTALSSAISEVFLIGLFIMIAGFIANLFIKEISLRRQHVLEDTLDTGKTGIRD